MNNRDLIKIMLTLSIALIAVIDVQGLPEDYVPAPHNCRLYGAMSDNFTTDLLYQHLVTEQNSLRNLASTYYIDGWGVVTYKNYNDTSVNITRGAVRAYNDGVYNTTIGQVNSAKPDIVLAHIRACTAGCCDHTETILNPHPFTRLKNNRTWTFEHNGALSIPILTSLLGNYTTTTPLTGSGITQCNPNISNNKIDSELFFLFLLKKIEQNNWVVEDGISAAIKDLQTAGETGQWNFILSDGEKIYGFRKGYDLSYVYDSSEKYSAVASQPPLNSHGTWTPMKDYQLVTLRRNTPPQVINDVRTYSSEVKAWSSAGWQYRKAITIDKNKFTQSINEFPLLIDITDADLAKYAKSNADDIVFISGDTLVKLNHEIESYNSATGRLVAWVNVDINTAQDNIIYMYYGNPTSLNQQNPQMVWDADYLMVQHLEEKSGSVIDSKGLFTGSPINGVVQGTSGKIDGSYYFDGNNDRVSLPKVFSNEKQFTIEAWINPGNKQGYAFSQWISNTGSFLQYLPGGGFELYVNGNTVKVPATVSQWHHVVASYNGSNAKLTVDGYNVASSNVASPIWPNLSSYVGDRSTFDRAFMGTIDELRISSSSRSDGYIKAAYENQVDSASFIIIGSPEIMSVPPEVISTYPELDAVDVELNATLKAQLFDINNDLISWKIEQFIPDTLDPFILLASGTASSNTNISLPTNFSDFNRDYYWRLTISDPSGSGRIIESTYHYITRNQSNYAPKILSSLPQNNEKDVSIKPNLSVYIKDIDKNSVTWSIQAFSAGTWQTIASGTDIDGDILANATANAFTSYETKYTWRAVATDPSGSNKSTIAVFNLTTRPANHKVNISNPVPENGSFDIPLQSSLGFDVSDLDNDLVNWSVQIWNSTAWQTVASGYSKTGNESITTQSIPIISSYKTKYDWRALATDYTGSMNTTIGTYSFTTRPEQYSPNSSEPYPLNGETAVVRNTSLTIFAEDKDGDRMDISFYIWSGSSWILISKLQNRTTGNYTVPTNGLMNQALTDYVWKVNITDSTGLSTENTFKFKTGGALTQKFTVTGTNTDWGQIMPVMGDVDNDGTQEIVYAGGTTLYVVNGKTGQVEYTMAGASGTSVELSDLDLDGVPEILVPLDGPYLRAINFNGTNYNYMWTTKLSGEGQSIFPIATEDVDGDGYPEIYFASEDITPMPYSGNDADYTGTISKLNHNGQVQATQPLLHPCWGGISIADTDFDGDFEIYVSDRRDRAIGNLPSKGLQAFDAKTLNRIWSRPDIHHSSPMAVIDDVNKDGKLDVIAQPILHQGVMVLDSTTGATMLDYSKKNLPTHGTGTVYDIDKDGHDEIILAVSDANIWPKDFVVFDLVNGSVDFQPNFDFWISWPPEVGSVSPDGEMEILAATGTQGSSQDYPLLIYDSNYTLVDQVTPKGAGQLTVARVYDTDSDGLNEVVLIGQNGLLYVYDTDAPTPNPAPRTWVQKYSNYRRGAAEYVAPPVSQNPFIKEEYPSNGASNVPLSPFLSARFIDFQNDRLNITFEMFINGSWTTIKTYKNVSQGVYSASTSGFVTNNDELYLWRVSALDSSGNSAQKNMQFVTAPGAPWTLQGWNFRKKILINKTSVNSDIIDFPLLVSFTDSDVALHAKKDGSDIIFTNEDASIKLPHEIEKYDSTLGKLNAWVSVNVSSIKDTVIYVYYGNQNASNQEQTRHVWDDDYLAVFHLNELNNTVVDSSANANIGTAQNGVNMNTEGKIDGADEFDGLNDRIQLPQIFSNEKEFTIESWMFIPSSPQQGYAVSQWFNSGGVFIQYFPTDLVAQAYINGNSAGRAAFSNAWHHVVVKYSAGQGVIIVDGTTPVTFATGDPVWPSSFTYLGDRSTFDRPFKGKLDEVRFSKIARSNDYIRVSYLNQNGDISFLKVFGEESISNKPLVFNEQPVDGATNVSILSGKISFTLFDNQNDLMNYTVTTSPNVGSGSATNVANGNYEVNISGLQKGITYTWLVNVTDGKSLTSRVMHFKTENPDVLVDSGFDLSSDSISLRSNGAGQDWYESRLANQTILTLDTENIAGDSGKKAKFTGTLGADAYLTQEFGFAQSGTFSVQMDVYIDSILDVSGSSDRTGVILIGDDSIAGGGPQRTDSERFVFLEFAKVGGGTSGNMNLVAVDRDDSFSSVSTIIAPNLSLKKWYTIRVDSNVPAGTYDVYVDGSKMATVTSRSIKPNLTHISFAHWTEAPGTFYIDNVYSPLSDRVKLTTGSVGNGLVDRSVGDSSYLKNSVVTLSATPAVGWNFTGWTGDVNGIENPKSIVLDSSKNVYANFELTNLSSAALLADSSFNESQTSADLRSDLLGTQDWYESRGQNPALLVLDTNSVGFDNTPKALLLGNNATNAYLTQEFYIPQTGSFTAQWDIYVDNILDISGNPDQAAWMLIGDNAVDGNGPNSNVGERFVYMAFFKNGGGSAGTMDLVAVERSGSRTSTTTIASGLNIKQWYNIKVDLNVPAGTYSVYVDGQFAKTLTSKNLKASVTHISFAQWSDGAGTFYVDNVQSPALNRVMLRTLINGSGSISRNSYDSSYLADSTVSLTATPSDGWSFAGWSGDMTGTTSPKSLIMNSNKIVYATFAQINQNNTNALADSTFDSSLDSISLRNNSAGQDWYESRNDYPLLLELDTSAVSGNSGKKAKLIGNSSRNAYLTQEFSVPQTGNVTVEWDVYVDNIIDINSSKGPDRAGWMLIGDDSVAGGGPNRADSERYVYMAFYKNGGGSTGTMDLVAINRTGTFFNQMVVASGMNLKQWYNISVIMNVPAGTYDVYVDRVKKNSIPITSRSIKTQLTHITFAQWDDGAGTFYIDNVYSPAIS